jgi:hypothetical protein
VKDAGVRWHALMLPGAVRCRKLEGDAAEERVHVFHSTLLAPTLPSPLGVFWA